VWEPGSRQHQNQLYLNAGEPASIFQNRLILSVKSCTIKILQAKDNAIKRKLLMESANNGTGQIDLIKVSATSRTSAVAGAIAGVMREHQHVDVQAIGASAVNQAVKALALAKGYLAEDGIDIVCMPHFVDVDIDGKVRTAIKFVVEPR
jgi:stage V sporulation protein S